MNEKDFISFEHGKHPFSKKIAAFSLMAAFILEIAIQNPSLTRKYVAVPLEKFRDEVVSFLDGKKPDSSHTHSIQISGTNKEQLKPSL
jgi:hypothetical protein